MPQLICWGFLITAGCISRNTELVVYTVSFMYYMYRREDFYDTEQNNKQIKKESITSARKRCKILPIVAILITPTTKEKAKTLNTSKTKYLTKA